MPKIKDWPVVHLVHWMLRRHGETCDACGEVASDVHAICHKCWCTGFVGGYTRAADTAYYVVRETTTSLGSDHDTWVARTYKLADFDVDFTRYCVGDLLIHAPTGTRWKVFGFGPDGIATRRIQPYESAAWFPTS